MQPLGSKRCCWPWVLNAMKQQNDEEDHGDGEEEEKSQMKKREMKKKKMVKEMGLVMKLEEQVLNMVK